MLSRNLRSQAQRIRESFVFLELNVAKKERNSLQSS